MKKILVIFLFTCTFLFPAFCQTTLFYQNFEASTNHIPAGWHQQLPSADPTNHGWQFNNVFPAVGLWGKLPISSYCAFIADTVYNSTMVQNYDTLYSPIINCVGHRLIYLGQNFIMGYENPDETISVAVSGDSGKTWTSAQQLGGYLNNWTDSVSNDISALAAGKPYVEIAYCYQDGCGVYPARGFGTAIDNVDVYDPDDSLYKLFGFYINNPYLMVVKDTYYFTGVFINEGIDTITSATINYTVNGGPPVSSIVTGIPFFYLHHEWGLKCSVPFVPTNPGNYVIKVYPTNLNGSHPDQVPSIDTITAHFTVVDTLQKRDVLFEEFTSAGCGPCLLLAPLIDTVLRNNVARCHPVIYHQTYPLFDEMDEATKYFIVPRSNYYYGTSSGVPYPLFDGYPTQDDTTGISTKYINQEVAVGSPFSIKINSFIYNPLLDTMMLEADIEAYADIPTTIMAQAVITVDTMNFLTYQDPGFLYFLAPPKGTGNIPDDDTIFMKRFDAVAEDMMPTANGTALAPFTTWQTQHISLGWKKNHPWSDNLSAYPYDSSSISVTVFVQDTNIHSLTGVANKNYVYQCATAHPTIDISTSDKNINQKGGNVFVYPNPSNGVFTLQWLVASGKWSVEVYNVLGEKVYSTNYPPWIPQGKLSTNHYSLDLSSQPSGVYLYRVIANDGKIIGEGKLVIEK